MSDSRYFRNGTCLQIQEECQYPLYSSVSCVRRIVEEVSRSSPNRLVCRFVDGHPDKLVRKQHPLVDVMQGFAFVQRLEDGGSEGVE